jgi:hypothetical protein
MPKLSTAQIAIIAAVVVGIPGLFWLCRPNYDLAGYILIGGTVLLAITVIGLQYYEHHSRRRHWPTMIFPSSTEMVASSQPPDAELRAEYGDPPKIEDFFEEILPADGDGWTHQFLLSELAEPFLGTVQFSSLERRFGSTPGVKRAHHEDREVFLIQTENLTPDQIRQAFWQHFLAAAKESAAPV